MLEENEEDAEDFTRIFHDGNQDIVGDLIQLLSGGMYGTLADADAEKVISPHK